MEEINSRAKTDSNSQVETGKDSQVDSNINPQVETQNNSRVEEKTNSRAKTGLTPRVRKAPAAPEPVKKGGRPRIYASKADAMKAYRATLARLHAEGIEAIEKHSTTVLSDLLVKSLRTLNRTAKTPECDEAAEARKVTGRIMKVLRARHGIKLG
jgi:hypothetical protein